MDVARDSAKHDPLEVTEFQRRVYDALKCIPEGCVTTYKLLGEHLGCRSYQAVGQALRRNPFAPEVPCHRVISSDLRIGGFGGEISGENVRRKIDLLAAEGVRFHKGKLAEPSRIHILTPWTGEDDREAGCG